MKRLQSPTYSDHSYARASCQLKPALPKRQSFHWCDSQGLAEVQEKPSCRPFFRRFIQTLKTDWLQTRARMHTLSSTFSTKTETEQSALRFHRLQSKFCFKTTACIIFLSIGPLTGRLTPGGREIGRHPTANNINNNNVVFLSHTEVETFSLML